MLPLQTLFGAVVNANILNKLYTYSLASIPIFSNTIPFAMVCHLVKLRKNQLLSSILLGDAVHNFLDGVFIGVAFKGCAKILIQTITASTIDHELAQELADYSFFSNQCGIKPTIVLLLNFISGLSGVSGAIIMMIATNPTDTAIGILL